jgi:HD-like signal output (HDOD) protein
LAESEVFGADHAEIGAYLLGLWGLPASVIDAVARHHKPIPADGKAQDLSVAVALARILAHEALRARGNDGVSEPADETAGGLLESVWENLAEWRRFATEEVERLSAA